MIITMSGIAKSQMTVDGNHITLSMPFAKVDENKRLVSGFATLDNVDTQGDIVLAEASAKAFKRARGNIREMHQPLAVGRMVDFREDEYYDEATKKFYRGIYVTARVSKGAQDTWEKVLDGTLSGFSIGGDVIDSDNEFNKDAGTNVRLIKDYNLVELSLVDNPANQLANIVSFQKSDTGMTVKGMAVETVIENVFVCTKDDTVAIKAAESNDCPQCGTKMDVAGWFEEGPDRAEKVDEIVSKFRNPLAKEAAPISDEGGVDMGTENPEVEETETEPVQPEEVEEETAVVEEVEGPEEVEVEEAVAPEETVDETDEISKKIDELHKAVQDSLTDTKGEFNEQVEGLKKFVEEQLEPLITKTSELEEKWNEFGEKLEVSKNRLAEFEARLEKMNSSDAVRKSGDLDEEATDNTVQKGIWSPGAFSGKSSYFSVNDL